MNMSTFGKRIAAVAAPALALVTFGMGVPAHAAGAPTLTPQQCDASMGRGQWECSVDVSGGTAPYSYRWTPGLDTSVQTVYNSATNTDAFGHCDIYRAAYVSLTVTDSAGNSVSQSYSFYCNDIPL